MLHIIGLILKVIGILILVILGIIVLLLCTVLFVPIKYQIEAEFPGKIEELVTKAKITWFFRLICVDVWYKESILNWHVRAAWKHMGSDVEEKEPVKEEPVKEELVKKEQRKKELAKKEDVPIKKTEDSQSKPLNEPKDSVKPKETETTKKVEKEQSQGKIQSTLERIKCTFKKNYDKIKMGLDIKAKVMNFLENKVHKAAFSKVIKELIWLKRFFKIKEGNMNLRFGFEDPSLTGKVLAGLSVLYPFLGDNMDVKPEFEEVCLEGSIYLKGHMRLIHIVILAIRLIIDKNVRKTFKDIMELKDQLV